MIQHRPGFLSFLCVTILSCVMWMDVSAQAGCSTISSLTIASLNDSICPEEKDTLVTVGLNNADTSAWFQLVTDQWNHVEPTGTYGIDIASLDYEVYGLFGGSGTKVYALNNNNWSAVTTNLPTGYTHQSLAIDPNSGDIYVAGRNDLTYYSTVWTWNGISWDTVGTMDFSGRGTSNLEVEVFNDTSVYVAFRTTVTSARPWVYRYDGNSWYALDTVVTLGSADAFDLEISPSNVPFMAVFSDNLTYGVQLYSFNGSSWSTLHTGNNMFQINNCESLDIEFIGNDIYYIFDDYFYGDVFLYHYDGTWSTLSHPDFSNARLPSLEVDHGQLVISFRNNLRYVRQYERRIGTNWEPYFVDQDSLPSFYVPKMVLGQYAFPNALFTSNFYINSSPNLARGPDIDSLFVNGVGTYALVGIDSCTDYRLSNLFILDYKPLPQYNLSIDHVSCKNFGDAHIEITPNPASTISSFIWSTGDTTYLIDSLTPGSYVANFQGNYCLLKDTIVITEPDVLSLSFQGVSESCGNAGDGMILNNTTGGTQPYEVAISGVAVDTGNVKHLNTGTYNVWLTDANGCRDNSTVTVGISSAPSPVMLSGDTTRTLCEDSILLHASHSNTEKQWWHWTDMNSDFNLGPPSLPGDLRYIFVDRDNQMILTKGEGIVRRQSGQSNFWHTLNHYHNPVYPPENLEYDYQNGVLISMEYESNYLTLRLLYDGESIWKSFGSLVVNGSINDVAVQHFQGYFYALLSFDSIPAALYRYDKLLSTWVNTNSNVFPTGTQKGIMRVMDGNQLLFAGLDQNNNLILKKGIESNLTVIDSASRNLHNNVWDVEQKSTGELLLYYYSIQDGRRYFFSYQNNTWDTLAYNSHSGSPIEQVKIYEHPSGQLFLTSNRQYTAYTHQYIRGKLYPNRTSGFGSNSDNRTLAMLHNGGMMLYEGALVLFVPEKASYDDSAYVHSTGLYQQVNFNGSCYAYSPDVWVNPALEIDATVLNHVSCKDGSDAAATVEVSSDKGTWPYSYAWNNAAITDTIANLEDGQYHVNVTDADNCVRSDTVNIREPDSLLILSVGTSSPACLGGKDGSAKASVSGGTLPYVFSWPGQSWVSQDSVVIPAQSFQVNVLDSNGCADSATATVPAGLTTFSPLTITGVDSMECTSDSVVLTGVSAAADFQWYDLTQGTWDTIGNRYIDHIAIPSNHRYEDMDIGYDELGYLYTVGRIDPNYYLQREYLRVNLFNKVGWSRIGGNIGSHEEIRQLEIEVRNAGTPVIAYIVRDYTSDTLFIKEWNGDEWVQVYMDTGRINHIDLKRHGSSTYFIYAKDGENFARFGEITNAGFVPIQQLGTTQVYEVQFDNNDNGTLSIFLLRQSASTIYYDASLFHYNGTLSTVTLNQSLGWGPGSAAFITNDDEVFVLNFRRFEKLTPNGWATLESFGGAVQPVYKVNNDGVAFRVSYSRIQQYNSKDGWIALNSPFGFKNFYFDPCQLPIVIEGDTPYTNDPFAYHFIPDSISGATASTYTAHNGDYLMLQAGTNDCNDKKNEVIKTASVQYDDYEYLYCPDDSVNVSAIPLDFNDTTSIVWNTGDTVYDLGLRQKGEYIFTITDGTCIITDTIVIDQVDDFQFSIDSVSDIGCPGETSGYVKLNVVSAYGFNVLWDDISNTNITERNDLTAGTYNPVLRISGCNYYDTLSFSISDPEGFAAPQVTSPNNLTVCDSMPVDLTCISDTSTSVTWMSFDSTIVNDVTHTGISFYSQIFAEKDNQLYTCREIFNTNQTTLVKLNNQRWDPVWEDSTGHTVNSLFLDTAGNLMLAGQTGSTSLRKTEILQFGTTDTSVYATLDHPNYSFTDAHFKWIGNTLYVIAFPYSFVNPWYSNIYFAKYNGSSWDSLPAPSINVDRSYPVNFSQDLAGNFWIGAEDDNTNQYKVFKLNTTGWTQELTYAQQVSGRSGLHVLPDGTVAVITRDRISSNNNNFSLFTYDGTAWDTISERHTDMINTYIDMVDVTHDPAGNLMIYFGDNLYTLKGNTWEHTSDLTSPGFYLRFIERSCAYPFITTNYRGLRLTPGTVEGTGDSISVSEPGVYVPVSEKDGCFNNDACHVVVNPALNYNLEQIADINCYGDSTAGISVEVLSGSAPYTFDWSTDDTTQTIDSIAAGWYTVTVTDFTGCAQTDSIEIQQPQAIDIQLTQLTDVGCASDSSGQLTVSATGGSGPLSVIWSTLDSTWNISGLAAGNYTATVTDTMNCSADSIFVIQAFDTLPPQLIVNNIVLYLDSAGQASITPLQPDTFYVDSCGLDSVSVAKENFTCLDLGMNQVIMEAFDLSNTSTDTLNVMVLDTTKPTLLAHQLPMVILDSNGFGMLQLAAVDSGSFDNCSLASLTLSRDSFNCNDVGTQTIWLRSADPSGNADSIEVDIQVLDTIEPNLTAAPIDLYLNINGEASFNLMQMGVGSSDNCGIDTLWAADTLYDCNDLGLNTNWVYATDANGNTDSIQLSFQVLDTLSPVARPHAQYTVSLNASGYALINPNDLDSASADNCTLSNMSSSIDSVTCADIGQVVTQFKVTDQNGLSDSINVILNVQDTTAPNIITQNVNLYLDNLGNATLGATDIDNGSTDNCAIQQRTLSKSNFSCTDLGANQVWLTVTDNHGNKDSLQATVTVIDSVKPTVVALMTDTIYLDQNGEANIVATAYDLGSTDNCGGLTFSLSKTNFQCIDLGNNPTTFTATDGENNSGQVTINIFVTDSIAPVITCFGDTGICVGQSFSPEPVASDNCAASVTQLMGPTNSSSLAVGTYTYTYEAKDSTGNTATCSYVLTVADYPDVDLGPDTGVNPGTQLNLQVKAGYESYLWSTGDTDRDIDPTVNSDTTFWVQASNEYGCTSSDTIHVSITFVGVEQLGNFAEQIKVYPNPTSTTVYLQFKEDIPQDLQIDVLASNGQLVQNIPMEIQPKIIAIDFTEYASGIYWIRLGWQGQLEAIPVKVDR